MRGATNVKVELYPHLHISIHAPHAGCDGLSGGGSVGNRISIHAPHAGCDFILIVLVLIKRHFNPRTPCGVRLSIFFFKMLHFLFQSTHPMRGATQTRRCSRCDYVISIHAPHAGCDLPPSVTARAFRHFNPRTPCGVRPPSRCARSFVLHFNPRTPCGVRLKKE